MKTLAIVFLGLMAGFFIKDRMPALYRLEVSRPTTVTQNRPLTDTEIIANAKHPEQLMVIYTLESSQGKQDGCKKQGKYNGFGFRQNSFEHVCYDTFQEVVTEVDNWLTNKDAINYCLYNEGKSRNDCPYAKNALTLLEK